MQFVETRLKISPPKQKIAATQSQYSHFANALLSWCRWICDALSHVFNARAQTKAVPDFDLCFYKLDQELQCSVEVDATNTKLSSVHTNKILLLFRCVGYIHYHNQAMDGMTPEEMCFYDTHCIATSAIAIFQRLLDSGGVLPEDTTVEGMTLRAKVALVCCLLISIKFENDICEFPAVKMLWKVVSPDPSHVPTVVTNEPHIISTFEKQILNAVNVFSAIENNHHRIAIEHVLQMMHDHHIDHHSAKRAVSLLLYFVFNTFQEAEICSQNYSHLLVGQALSIATLVCLQQADAIPTPRKTHRSNELIYIARCLLSTLVKKPVAKTARVIGGPLLEPGTWQHNTIANNNIQNAIHVLA